MTENEAGTGNLVDSQRAEIAALKEQLRHEHNERIAWHGQCDLAVAECGALKAKLAEAEAVIREVSELKAGGCAGCTEAAAVGSGYCRACSFGRAQILSDSYLARHGKGGK